MIRRHLNPSMVVALIALFVALGGVSYAAISIPRNSVGTAQIKRAAVDSIRIKDRSIRAGDIKAGVVPVASPRAYGKVVINGSGFYELAPGSKGVVAVTQGVVGNSVACIQLAPSINAASAVVAAIPNLRSDVISAWDTHLVVVDPGGYCSGTNIVEIATTMTDSPGGVRKSAFNFVIP